MLHSLRKAVIAGLILANGYALVKIMTLDAYGQCLELDNFGLCFDGWLDFEQAHLPFKKLISDQEMMAIFQANRASFDLLVRDAQRTKDGGEDVWPKQLDDPALAKSLGINWITRKRDYSSSKTICLPPTDSNNNVCSERVFQWIEISLIADKTRFIERNLWPYSNLVKSYLFLPNQKPATTQIDASDAKSHDQTSVNRSEIVSSLDEMWPAGWPTEIETPPCLTRHIGDGWALQLCRNQIGG